MIRLNLERPQKRSTPAPNPAVPIGSPEFWALMSGERPTDAGEHINVHVALQQATVLACCNVLANGVSSLRLRLYKRNENGRIEATEEPLHRLLSAAPNEEMTNVDFFFALVGSLALHGNSYAFTERNGAGAPIGLWPLLPQLTHPIRLLSGELAYETTEGNEAGRPRLIQAADMLHVKLFTLDGVLGLSPIAQARQSIGLAIAAEKFGARFFANNATPSVAIEIAEEVDAKSKALMREEWERLHSGRNAHRIAILDQGMKITPFSISPEDAQFLSTRQFQRAEIAAIFGVPAHYVGELQKMSNSNVEQMNLAFITDTLRPFLVRIEAEIARKLLPRTGGYVVEFDTAERLRGDLASLSTAIATGIYAGYLSRNDGRRMMRMNIGPVELDEFLAPVNYQDAKRLLDKPTA